MNPIGLTRAEETKEQQTPAPIAQPPAPAGVVQCIATLPPDGKKCGATAIYRIVWNAEDAKDPVCADCADRLRAQASAAGSNIGLEKLSGEGK